MSYQGTKINPSRFDKSQIKFFLVLVPLAAFMALPILYIVTTAFKPLDELFAYPPRFFARRPSLENFRDIAYVVTSSGIPLSRYILNSVVTSVIVVVFSVMMSASAGYVLSKKKFKGRKLLFTINTVALMFVPAAVKIPRYLVIEKAGLLDSFFILVLPLLAMPVGLFLVKQYIDQVPDSLIEAATIDGASDYAILRRVVMPVIKPALVTVAILAFQSSWNTAEPSTFYVNDDALKTFAFYMSAITTQTGNTVAGQGIAAAASLILFIPNLVIFILMQSNVINTMAHSGIK
ncbi:ABC transporter permease [Clostridium thermosuccinogenes]|uniref:ABC transporter permease n=1 Tax=Clostridium thermosuccinogenes TaxID=84032 RepID=A0A2K2FCG3_9CLOT|nr:carbohydrate ABC transporter permease [Pseudoclostridium thermosuccinogenes]AUS98273.1 ABC transporter permease [Pseudoclostridium thermosuccinogenes]PNT96465.1 ABC transporter permease [Pseudoclostridium thermosuccinogenes]PNT98155.1 ABC transporter permease [Pseudoclostridium thermosuccinogenes]